MLTLNNVSAGYEGHDVISNISLSVAKGENLCVLGPNGCGKTTLIKTISGLIPHSGTIIINGINLDSMNRTEVAKNIAVMSQISTIYFSYTVYETVLLGRYLHMKGNAFKEPSLKDREYADKCLKAVGLFNCKNKQINTLSGGQLQRVYLARTLAQEPNIILLDEPTNHLDLKHQTELIDFLKDWSKIENHTVIGVFHDLNLAINLADNILLLDNGKIASYGKTNDVISSKLLNEVYEMDIANYMLNSLKQWECIQEEPRKTKLRKIK
ncbi:MAG: ABC transporter ATP-binding protein [Sedimentibacter sp.]|uniref:ABC transporter ATP-binding protein n=1 Tax=Sedimentibacter sp. TaxID=1960295 RepID=UPI002981D8CA|nr:ABC transporter ATP-binding protein [Sedimentibacter sp.]MDW5299970.1 ABC transporter ATP-binding protein [Sedimentibacter sp.]